MFLLQQSEEGDRLLSDGVSFRLPDGRIDRLKLVLGALHHEQLKPGSGIRKDLAGMSSDW